jgi:hypothetical protein
MYFLFIKYSIQTGRRRWEAMRHFRFTPSATLRLGALAPLNFSLAGIDGQAPGGIFPCIKLSAIGPEAVAPLRSVLFFSPRHRHIIACGK